MTEQQLDNAISQVKTETQEGGNTRGRIADLFTGLKNWAKGSFVRTVNNTAPDANGNVTIEAGGNVPFKGEDFITNIGSTGIPSGTNFRDLTVRDILAKEYQTVIAPGVTLTASDSTREFGSSPSTTLTWGVTRQSEPITEITIDGQVIAVTGNSQAGTLVRNAAQDVTTTFNITVKTATKTVTASATVNWRHNRFYFTDAANLMAKTDAELSTLLSSGNVNKEFAQNRDQPARSMTGTEAAPRYCYFANLSSYGVASFKVNGFDNTAFTRKAFTYTNASGVAQGFDLYMYNDPIQGATSLDIN